MFLTFPFLGALAVLQKVTGTFDMSVRPSTRNNWAAIGRICMKFDIWAFFFENLSRKIQV
jgi:hypothetical protein